MKKMICLSLIGLTISASQADEIKVDTSYIKQFLQPGVEITDIKKSPLDGIYEIYIGNEIAYLSSNGKTLFNGEIYDLATQRNLTDLAKSGLRKEAIKNIPDADKIVFKAANEKYRIDVFTDITCPYCTKLHNNMQAYNDAGITIRYLAYPRAGWDSEPGKEMQSIWCSDNPQEAIGNAKNQQDFVGKDCDKTQVKEQFEIANSIGVNATPTLVFESGEVRPGYLDPTQLIKTLESIPELNQTNNTAQAEETTKTN